MKKLDILKDPNPILREETLEVVSFDGQTQELIDNMIYTMRVSDGIGLAAPQVGERKKIIVAEYETPEKSEEDFKLSVIINPKVEYTSEEQVFTAEGCLSFPGKELYVKRPKGIRVRAVDRWGKEFVIEDEGLLARVLQHEIDHLNGVLMVDHIKTLSTVFIGNGSLGLPILERLTDDPQFNLSAVFTTIDRPAGRNGEYRSTEIAKLGQELGQKVVKTGDINSEQTIKEIKKLAPDLIVLADFNQIIKKDLINLPKYGVLNIHPSLLPKYRGPSPIVSAMLAGEKQTGVSIIKLNEKVDAGDVLSQIQLPVKAHDTATSLKIRLAEYGAALLAETVPYYIADEIRPLKQIEEQATYTKKFGKSDGKITTEKTDIEIDRMVRALNPWPGVYAEKKGKKIFITKSHLNKEKKLIIDAVKPEGKREMSYKEYLAGNDELTFGN